MTANSRRNFKAEAMARLLLVGRSQNDAILLAETMGREQWLALDLLYLRGCGLKRDAYVPSPATKRLVLTHLRTLTAPGEYDWIDQLADATPDSGVRRIA